ncbi:MAG: hypothetical protein K0Q95_1237 [Bacteroidota bacterium]|jgi:hypothetical protein|nr:hypothetical protein [Bacteroidota bacterium]
MKKIILFAAVISAFSFASCKKDRSCTCTSTSTTTTVSDKVYDNNAKPAVSTTTTDSNGGTGVIIFNDAKKKDAKKACIDETSENVYEDSYESSDFDFSTFTSYPYTMTITSTTNTENKCSLK